MKPRSRKIAVIATVVCLLNLQRLISQITLQNLTFLRERMMEDFVQESESLLFLTALLLSVHRRRGNFRQVKRRVWAWPRPQNWFDVMLASPRLNVLWKPNFRMERETFDELCRIYRGDLTRQETRLRKPVSVEKHVAVGVWRLSTGNSYRSCRLQFGLGKSTAKVICQEFEEALCRKKKLFYLIPLH